MATPRRHVCAHPGCERAFSKLSNLKQHERIHTGERPFACPQAGCGKRFRQSGNLNKHMRSHGCEQLRWKRNVSTKPFPCAVEGCGKSFTAKSSLTIHMRVHTGEKPYACTVPGCGQRFRHRAGLRGHQRGHEDTTDQDEELRLGLQAPERRSELLEAQLAKLLAHVRQQPPGPGTKIHGAMLEAETTLRLLRQMRETGAAGEGPALALSGSVSPRPLKRLRVADVVDTSSDDGDDGDSIASRDEPRGLLVGQPGEAWSHPATATFAAAMALQRGFTAGKGSGSSLRSSSFGASHRMAALPQAQLGADVSGLLSSLYVPPTPPGRPTSVRGVADSLRSAMHAASSSFLSQVVSMQAEAPIAVASPSALARRSTGLSAEAAPTSREHVSVDKTSDAEAGKSLTARAEAVARREEKAAAKRLIEQPADEIAFDDWIHAMDVLAEDGPVLSP